MVDGHDSTVNIVQSLLSEGSWPLITLSNIAVIGAFAGYAGGGGLSNATYSNFVRDKGWGMGTVVGAIPSAVGGRAITLSHVGKVFAINDANLAKWKMWWRYILVDQIYVWAPGCFMGMAHSRPALPGIRALFQSHRGQAGVVSIVDHRRWDPACARFSATVASALWIVTVLVGLLVMLPSQMSIVDDFSRRWTDILWSGSRRIRGTLEGNAVKRIYYTILGIFVAWTAVAAYLFSTYGTPKLMTLVIANLNNLSIGATSFHVLWINCRMLPRSCVPAGISGLASSPVVSFTWGWPCWSS